MNEYLARLNPAERRFVVAVALLFFVVINIFWVWPRFSDWGKLKGRLNAARAKMANYDAVILQRSSLESDIRKLQGEGQAVPLEDQATEFFRVIQTQALQNGVNFIGSSRPTMRTNDQFFIEQVLTVQVQATEKQLVDFLYSLGSGDSLIRVRGLSVRPDPNRYQLGATITLVASYQKAPKAPAASASPATAAAAKAPATPGAAPASKPATSAAKPTSANAVRPAEKPAPAQTAKPPPKPAPANPSTPKTK